MPRVILVGLSLSGNKGGPAIFASLSRLLRRYVQPLEVTLVSTYPRDARWQQHYGVEHIVPHPAWQLANPLQLVANVRKSQQLYRGSDLVIDMTGVKFVGGRGLKTVKTHLRSASHIHFPKSLGIPVAVFTQTYGPLDDAVTRWFARRALGAADLVFAREPQSMAELGRIGLEQRASLYPDVAFTLPASDLGQVPLGLERRAFLNKTEPFVAFSASNKVILEERELGQKPRYEQLCVQFLQGLLDDGQRVLLVPHSFQPQSPAADDFALTQRIYAQLNAPTGCAALVEEDLPPEDLKAIIARAGLFAGSRYHSLIAALSSGVPSLAIGWSHKYDGLLALFDMQSFCFSAAHAPLQDLQAKFSELQRERPAYQQRILQRLPNITQQVEESVRRVAALLTSEA